MQRCAECHTELAPAGRGRPRMYCSPACRARAHRARQGTREPDGGPHLTIDRIVRAAVLIADTEGLDALNMRRLAGALGAGTMSLYRHVPGKERLLALMLEAAIGEEPQPDPWPTGWRAGLEYTARRDWRLYRRHPWILPEVMVGARTTWDHNAAIDGERALASFDGLGLTGGETLRYLTMVTGYTQGMAMVLLREIEEERRSGLTFEQWWHTGHGPAAQRVLASGPYPRMRSLVGDRVPFTSVDDLFTEGLTGLLDGIGALLGASGRLPPPTRRDGGGLPVAKAAPGEDRSVPAAPRRA